MNDAYKPLLDQLSGPLLCPRHSQPNCHECRRARRDDQYSELVAGCEDLLRKVAAEDARYHPNNVDDDNDTNKEHDE